MASSWLPRFLRPTKTVAAAPPGILALTTPVIKSVPNPAMTVQEQTRWCWSAVTQSVRAIRGLSAMSQAEIAHDHVKRSGNTFTCSSAVHDSSSASACKDGGCTIVCNSNHMLRMVLHQHGLFAGKLSTPLDRATIDKNVGAGLPIALRVEQSDGHFILVAGWSRSNDGREWVQILDPADGIAGQSAPLRNHPMARLSVNKYDSTRKGTFTLTHAYGTN